MPILILNFLPIFALEVSFKLFYIMVNMCCCSRVCPFCKYGIFCGSCDGNMNIDYDNMNINRCNNKV